MSSGRRHLWKPTIAHARVSNIPLRSCPGSCRLSQITITVIRNEA